MKTRLVISILLFLFLCFIVVFSNILGPRTRLEKSVIIEAPQLVVWRQLSSVETHDRWSRKATFGECEHDTIRRLILRTAQYDLGAAGLKFLEKIKIDNTANTISILPDIPVQTSFLEDFQTRIVIKSLADGSTEVKWNAEYQVRPIISRIMARAGLQPSLNSYIEESLSGLKKSIEQ
jgi:hypothetical protein